MKVLVTGASGFIGRSCVRQLDRAGFSPVAVLRSKMQEPAVAHCESVLVPDILDADAWMKALHGICAVVHLAARAHVINESSTDPDAEYAKVNVEGTRVLLECCAARDVRRFVYMSSIKVNGEATEAVPFSVDDPSAPIDPYGRSKRDAESLIRHVCEEHDIGWTIIRPPLVYGPGVKANFARLVQLVGLGVPIPLGACKNKRAMIYVGNLCSLISEVLSTAASRNKLFLASDGNDLAVADLVRHIGEEIGRPAMLLPIPTKVLSVIAAILGRSDEMRRLTQSLEIDIDATRRILGWDPPYEVRAALHETLRNWPG